MQLRRFRISLARAYGSSAVDEDLNRTFCGTGVRRWGCASWAMINHVYAWTLRLHHVLACALFGHLASCANTHAHAWDVAAFTRRPWPRSTAASSAWTTPCPASRTTARAARCTSRSVAWGQQLALRARCCTSQLTHLLLECFATMLGAHRLSKLHITRPGSTILRSLSFGLL